jgi:hypothetical protein
LELSGSQRRNAVGCPLGRRVMRSPNDEGAALACYRPAPTREPRRMSPRAAACRNTHGPTQDQETARAPPARRLREQAGVAKCHKRARSDRGQRGVPRCSDFDAALPQSASGIKRGHNVRHERRTKGREAAFGLSARWRGYAPLVDDECLSCGDEAHRRSRRGPQGRRTTDPAAPAMRTCAWPTMNSGVAFTATPPGIGLTGTVLEHALHRKHTTAWSAQARPLPNDHTLLSCADARTLELARPGPH